MKNNPSLSKQVISFGFIVVAGTLMSLPGLAQSGTGSMTMPATETPAVSPTPDTGSTSDVQATGTIVDLAAENPNFKTLVAALKAADLTDTLSGSGPFTVFAPTDAAFEALPKGTVEELLKPENKDKLKQILTYHVVQGEYLSGSIKSGKVDTVEGKPITIKVKGDKVMVNNARVTAVDVKGSNGVIHAIDKVILPPDV
jgi:uncharacterized surface protein with fasciclin (FAS1) repeats